MAWVIRQNLTEFGNGIVIIRLAEGEHRIVVFLLEIRHSRSSDIARARAPRKRLVRVAHSRGQIRIRILCGDSKRISRSSICIRAASGSSNSRENASASDITVAAAAKNIV